MLVDVSILTRRMTWSALTGSGSTLRIAELRAWAPLVRRQRNPGLRHRAPGGSRHDSRDGGDNAVRGCRGKSGRFATVRLGGGRTSRNRHRHKHDIRHDCHRLGKQSRLPPARNPRLRQHSRRRTRDRYGVEHDYLHGAVRELYALVDGDLPGWRNDHRLGGTGDRQQNRHSQDFRYSHVDRDAGPGYGCCRARPSRFWAVVSRYTEKCSVRFAESGDQSGLVPLCMARSARSVAVRSAR